MAAKSRSGSAVGDAAIARCIRAIEASIKDWKLSAAALAAGAAPPAAKAASRSRAASAALHQVPKIEATPPTWVPAYCAFTTWPRSSPPGLAAVWTLK